MLMRLSVRLAARGDSISTADETTSGMLEHSRNVLLGTLAKYDKAEWGLWLDSDCYLDPDAVLEASLRKENFIVWNYPVRIPYDAEYPPEHLIDLARVVRSRQRRWTGSVMLNPKTGGRTWSSDRKLLEMYRTAFGSVLMRREVALQMWWALPRSKPDWSGRTLIKAFDNIDDRVSEDYSFCDRYREAGGRIWCDPRPYVTNGGTGGCFADDIARCDAQMRMLPMYHAVAT
jgi:hypothetical protein